MLHQRERGRDLNDGRIKNVLFMSGSKETRDRAKDVITIRGAVESHFASFVP